MSSTTNENWRLIHLKLIFFFYKLRPFDCGATTSCDGGRLAHLRSNSTCVCGERAVQRHGSDAVHVAHGIAMQMPIGPISPCSCQPTDDGRWQLCIDHRLLESRTGRQSDAGHRRQHSAHDSPGRSRPRWKLTNVNCRRITAVRDALLSFSRPECDQICRLHRPVAQR